MSSNSGGFFFVLGGTIFHIPPPTKQHLLGIFRRCPPNCHQNPQEKDYSGISLPPSWFSKKWMYFSRTTNFPLEISWHFPLQSWEKQGTLPETNISTLNINGWFRRWFISFLGQTAYFQRLCLLLLRKCNMEIFPKESSNQKKKNSTTTRRRGQRRSSGRRYWSGWPTDWLHEVHSKVSFRLGGCAIERLSSINIRKISKVISNYPLPQV